LNLKVQFFWNITRVAAQIVLDVSKDRSVFILRIEQSNKNSLTAS